MSDFAEGFAVGQNNHGYGYGAGFGGDWAWIIIFAMIFGWGGNGAWGNNGGGNGQMMYDIGRLATTNDVASGFSTSAIMSNQGDLKLGQAGIQQEIMRSGMSLQQELSSCCCTTNRNIDQVRFEAAQNTCDLKQTVNSGIQKMLDYWCQRDMAELRNERDTYRNQLSQNAQTSTILNAINRPASPAYIVPNPYTGQYGSQYGNNCCTNNSCCNGWGY